MKASEAPEKIILSADRDTQIINDEWVINDYTDNIKIEYVRKDSFIEKAVDYIANNMRCDGYTLQTKMKFIKGFKNYLIKNIV